MKLTILIKILLLWLWISQADAESYKFYVAFAQDTLSNDYRFAQVKDVELAFRKYKDVKFVYSDANGSTAWLIKNIEDHIAAGIDLLMVSPDNAAALTPVISSIYKRGIPVVLVDRAIDSNDYTTLVHPDNKVIAKNAARYIMSKMDQGNILMLEGIPNASVTRERTDEFIKEVSKNKNINVIRRTANFLRADAMRVILELLEQGIEFDAIYSQSDSMLSGARLVLNKQGIDLSSRLTVGIDYIDEARTAIRAGEQNASFTYSLCGKESVEAAMSILNKKNIPKEIIIKSTLVTKNNVEKVEPIF
ncbi:MAG: substrate-binding domain-containing protein [Gammaproteobacteria bacterium]|nr:substrate-binding domain-containing protein [Gammaproteobacteria bacterium]MDH5734498.1 substrate-binding domain-containing protein [Gammaproteobacteria bacterium]